MFCLSRDTFLYSFTYAGGQLLAGILLGALATVLVARVIAWRRA